MWAVEQHLRDVLMDSAVFGLVLDKNFENFVIVEEILCFAKVLSRDIKHRFIDAYKIKVLKWL